MSICDFKAKIDVKNPNYIYNKRCKQNDTLILNLTVLDDSVPADLTGYTCMLKANKSKKAIEIRDAIIQVNNVKLQCPTSTTQFAGDLELELFFVNPTTGLQKTSFTISIVVEGSVIGDSDGNVPQNIITPLEKLDQNLSQLSGKISEATQINNTLNNTKFAADNTNLTLNNTINNANVVKTNCDTAKDNVNTAITNANSTINELKKTDSEYTEHINNWDIHVTKIEKDKWNAYEARITELTTIIDKFIYLDAAVTDDEGNNVTDDNNENVIM